MEEERNYKVYAHIRKEPDENGIYKRYIGITCQKLKDRWKANGNGYKKKDKNGNYIYFYNAIQKYGWDNFTHIILLQNLTKKEALDWEIKLIEIYESNNEYYGYNGTEGGEHALHSEKIKQKISNSHKGKIVSEITKDKLRKINTGKKLTMETRIKMSKTRKGMYSEELNPMFRMTGSKNPFYNKHHTKDSKEKISKANKSRNKKYDNNNKRVMCVETGVIYNSIGEANRMNNTSHISECCSGRRNIAGGYHWKYIDK